MKTLKVKELEVPVGAIWQVADLLSESELENKIVGVDEDESAVFVEVTYNTENDEQREALKQLNDIIDNYDEEDDDDDEEEEE